MGASSQPRSVSSLWSPKTYASEKFSRKSTKHCLKRRGPKIPMGPKSKIMTCPLNPRRIEIYFTAHNPAIWTRCGIRVCKLDAGQDREQETKRRAVGLPGFWVSRLESRTACCCVACSRGWLLRVSRHSQKQKSTCHTTLHRKGGTLVISS